MGVWDLVVFLVVSAGFCFCCVSLLRVMVGWGLFGVVVCASGFTVDFGLVFYCLGLDCDCFLFRYLISIVWVGGCSSLVFAFDWMLGLVVYVWVTFWVV